MLPIEACYPVEVIREDWMVIDNDEYNLYYGLGTAEAKAKHMKWNWDNDCKFMKVLVPTNQAWV